jgi:hypothetical protein
MWSELPPCIRNISGSFAINVTVLVCCFNLASQQHRWNIRINYCARQFTLIIVNVGTKWQVAKGGSTTDTAPTVLYPFHTHNYVTCRTFQLLFKQWSKIYCKRILAKQFIATRMIDTALHFECTHNRVHVSGTGITLPGRPEVSQAAAAPCRLQLSAVLGGSGIKKTGYRNTISIFHYRSYHWTLHTLCCCKGTIK